MSHQSIRYTGRDEPRCKVCTRKILYLQWVHKNEPRQHIHCTERKRRGYRAQHPEEATTMTVKQQLNYDIAKLMERQCRTFEDYNLPGMKLTLVARKPGNDEMYTVHTDDDLDAAIATIQRSKTGEAIAPPATPSSSV